MDNAKLALLIGVTIALVFGFFVARRSARNDKIYGGTPAVIFHYVGAAGVTGILPMVLTTLVLGGGFGVAFPLALSFLAVSWLGLLAYAIIERPARAKAKQQDRGWTEQDARTSY